MNLKEELDKAKYDLTSYQVDQLLALFDKEMNEIIGEDEVIPKKQIFNGMELEWDATSFAEAGYEEIIGKNELRASQRERLKKLMEVGDAK